MAAYIILIRERITDAEALATYASKAAKSTAGHTLEPLVYYGPSEALEGPPVDGVVIVKFPDVEAARRWYDSAEYQEALPYRKSGADCRVMLVVGAT